MSQAVNKSAISVLDEFCKRKIQPPAVYTFISDEDASNFVCTVKSFNETKTGRAKSKKKAKHVAAQNLINHLRSLESFKFDLVFLNVPSLSVDETKVSSSTTNEKKRKATTTSVPEINYVGQLLEYCTKSRLPPASFETVESTTKPGNLSEFSMKCTVNNIEKLGTGPNKKQAKRIAAMKVLEAIRLGETTPTGGSQVDDPPVKRLKVSDRGEGTDTLLDQLVNSAVKAETKVTPKENLISNHCNLSTDSNEDDDDEQFSDGCAADDCDEISDTFELHSTDSRSDSSGSSEEF